jgi:hypothetical protein
MFELLVAGRSSRPVLQAKYLMDASYWRGSAVQSEKPELAPDGRLLVIADLIRAIELLHAHGYAYNDLSANNVCIVNAELPHVFLLDADSITPIDAVNEPVVRTLGWEVDDRFDIAQRDWAKVAMFAWRLLVEEPSARPASDAVDEFDRRTATRIGGAIVALHERPDGAGARALHTAALAELSVVSGQRLVERAADLGHAREIVRLRDLASGTPQLVAEAEAHLLLEERVETAQGLQQRILLRGLRRQGDRRFVLDVRGVAIDAVPPTSVDEFERLVLSARFEELLGHFVDGWLSDFDSHPWLPRAVQHALIMEPAPEVSVTERAGVVSARFEWPRGGLIDVALLRIWEDRRLADTRVISRQAGHDAVRIEGLGAGLPAGTPVQAQVVFGVSGGSGSTVYCPESTTVATPAPQPVRRLSPRVPAQVRGSARRIARSSEALVDVARPDPQLPARRRRRNRRRAAVLGAVALVVGLFLTLRGDVDDPIEAVARVHAEGTEIVWAVRASEEPVLGVRSAVVQRRLLGPAWRRSVLAETGAAQPGETVRVIIGVDGTFRVRARLADGRTVRSAPLTPISSEEAARGAPPGPTGIEASADPDGSIVVRSGPLDVGPGRIVDHLQIIVSAPDGSPLLRTRTGRLRLALGPIDGVADPLDLFIRVRVVASDGARSAWVEVPVRSSNSDDGQVVEVSGLRREERWDGAPVLRWEGSTTTAFEVLIVEPVSDERSTLTVEGNEIGLAEVFASSRSDVVVVRVRVASPDDASRPWSRALIVIRPAP